MGTHDTGPAGPTAGGWEIVDSRGTPAAPPFEPVTEALRAYAEWFVWARRQGGDLNGCHAAARAAVTASLRGANALGAAEGALRSGTVTAVDRTHQDYVAWYAVAAMDLGYQGARAHAFAEGGLRAVREGQDIAGATAAAEAAAAEGSGAEVAGAEVAGAEVASAVSIGGGAAGEEAHPLPASAVPSTDTVRSLPVLPGPEVAGGHGQADAVAAAAAFLGLGELTRAEAKLVAARDLVLASGLDVVPEGSTKAWVVSMVAAGTASGTALPPTGCLAVMPIGLSLFWLLDARANRPWPDWFDRLPDTSR